jgi:hypothetical protein
MISSSGMDALLRLLSKEVTREDRGIDAALEFFRGLGRQSMPGFLETGCDACPDVTDS